MGDGAKFCRGERLTSGPVRSGVAGEPRRPIYCHCAWFGLRPRPMLRLPLAPHATMSTPCRLVL